jgi:hypothetical protein
LEEVDKVGEVAVAIRSRVSELAVPEVEGLLVVAVFYWPLIFRITCSFMWEEEECTAELREIMLRV